MSKSLGNVLDPFEVIDRFGVDALRFYLPARRRASAATGRCRSRASPAATRASSPTSSATWPAARSRCSHRYRDGVVPAGPPTRDLADDFDGLSDRVAELIDRAEVTQALEEIWRRVRRLNRYVEEQAPWQLAKDPARAEDLDRVLRTLAEGLRVAHRPAARRGCPRPRRSCSTPSARRTSSLSGAALGGGALGAVARLEPLFPKQRPRPPRVIDSHTHLDVLRGARRGARRRGGRAPASRGSSPSGMDGPTVPRGAARPRETLDGVRAAIGRHPNHATGFGDADADELAELAAGDAGSSRRSARPGLDFFRDTRPARRPGARLPRPARPRPRPGQAARHPHARGGGRDARDAARRADGLEVVLHCFSMPDHLDECLERGLVDLLRRERDLPGDGDLAAAAERVPDDRLLVETDAPYLTPQAGSQGAQPPRARRPHRPLRGRAPRAVAEELEARRRPQRREALRLVSATPATPTQPSLRRLRQFGVRPKRDLGQNFLVDSNILGVIERAAELTPDDVVLEVGGGLGRPQRAPRAARARTSTWSRSTRARARAARRARRPSEHDAPRRRRDGARPRRAGPRADEGRRQPALRHRRRRDPPHARGAARRHPLGRDGPEGGRRAPRRARPGRRPTACPPCWRSSAADVRVHRAVSRTVFHPVPERRQRARRARAHRARRAPGAAPPRQPTRSPTGARRSRARSRSRPAPRPASATAPARRSRASGSRPTCAPSASRPRTSAARGARAGEPRAPRAAEPSRERRRAARGGARRRSTSASSSGRPARTTAGTSSSPPSSR